MGSKNIDKAKPSNWEDGDTFAVEIKNTNTEYDGKYLILNKCFETQCQECNNVNFFRAKLTKDSILPINKDEIEQLEYIKTRYTHYLKRYFPLSGCETYDECVKRKSYMKFYPDEYNYLYTYLFELFIERKDKFDNFIFLGNYKLTKPKDEFISDIFNIESFFVNKMIIDLINDYEKYNKKKEIIYDEKQRKIIEKYVLNEVKAIKMTDEIRLKMREIEEESATEEEYKRKMKQLFFSTFSKKMSEEDDEDYYHETYVGEDILTSDEKQYDEK